MSGNTATQGAGLQLGTSNAPLIGITGSKTGSVALDNSTIDGNTASSDGGGIYLNEYGVGSPSTEESPTITIDSTIVAGNTASGSPQDLFRPPTSTNGGVDTAFSLIQTPGNAPLLSQQQLITGVDPELEGARQQRRPDLTRCCRRVRQPAVIDQGHAPTSLTTDQRGDPRTVDTAIPNAPGGDGTDIGAVELPASSVVIPPKPQAGFSASIRGVTLGSGSPLLIGNWTPVSCAVKIGSLDSGVRD